jgi:hypothetical protein
MSARNEELIQLTLPVLRPPVSMFFILIVGLIDRQNNINRLHCLLDVTEITGQRCSTKTLFVFVYAHNEKLPELSRSSIAKSYSRLIPIREFDAHHFEGLSNVIRGAFVGYSFPAFEFRECSARHPGLFSESLLGPTHEASCGSALGGGHIISSHNVIHFA